MGAFPIEDYCGRVRPPSSLKAPATVTRGRGFDGCQAGRAAVSKDTTGCGPGAPRLISLPIEKGTTSASRSSTGVLGRHIRRRFFPGRLTGWKPPSAIADRSARIGRSSRNCEGLEFLPTSGAPSFTRRVRSLGSLFSPNPAMAGAAREFHGQPANSWCSDCSLRRPAHETIGAPPVRVVAAVLVTIEMKWTRRCASDTHGRSCFLASASVGKKRCSAHG